jgi:hypothetical protein
MAFEARNPATGDCWEPAQSSETVREVHSGATRFNIKRIAAMSSSVSDV